MDFEKTFIATRGIIHSQARISSLKCNDMITTEDFYSAGCEVFIHCYNHYKPEKAQFTTYLTSSIKWNFKNMIAKEKNIACLLVSQLSREIEKRIDPRPRMSDYAESGVIEQVCENALFVFYGYHFDPENEEYGEFKSEIISAKARYGKPGRFEVGFNGNRCRFYGTVQEAEIDKVGKERF